MIAVSKKNPIAVAVLAVAALTYTFDPSLQAVEEDADQAELPNRHPRMVHEYFITRLKQIEKNADKKRNAITTRQQAEAYVSEVRAKIDHCFGPWPEKTPLNARTVKTFEREGYTVENVIYESRPNFLVSANLYIPKGKKLPAPAVLGVCGHSHNGKASRTYQSFSQALALQGYVVLTIDPIGQGERLQYLGEDLKSWVGGPVFEHMYAGNQQVLVGESFASWRTWDGIRGIDYLVSREEVDPSHIGVTGSSGGGTQSTWICANDRRITMGAPSCFITTFRRNFENELPSDSEQYPPFALSQGLDMSDFLAAMAPKPVLILAQYKDFFDWRGAQESYENLLPLYRALDAEDDVAIHIGPEFHSYGEPSREKMYHLFNRATGVSNTSSEPNVAPETDRVLWCSPRGQVVADYDSRTVSWFTRAKSKALAAERSQRWDTENLKLAVRRNLRLDAIESRVTDESVPYVRVTVQASTRPFNERSLYPKRFAVYSVETEPGILAIVYRLIDEEKLQSVGAPTQRPAILYVSHQSSDEDLRNEPLIRDMLAANPGADFYTCDVRGIGESKPDIHRVERWYADSKQWGAWGAYGSDYMFAGYSLMLDEPYVGQRTFDVMRVVTWLKSLGHERIHVIGRGWGSLPGAFAALLSDDIDQVTLKNALVSYQAIAESGRYAWPLSSLMWNVLEDFDLPDVYRELENGKGLKMTDTWDENAE